MTEREATVAIYQLLAKAGETRLEAAAFAKLEAEIEKIANACEDPDEVLEHVGEPLGMLAPL
jgi:hypothetical protein